MLSFILSEAGEVTEAMIEDSSGGPGFEGAAMAALVGWRYTPAMLNGKPVDQSITTVMRFQLDRDATRASIEFKDSFNEVQRLLAAKDIGGAESILERLRSVDGRNVYEAAWLWWLEYLYSDVTNGDVEKQHEALTKAIGYEVMYLDPDLFVVASARLFTLRVKAGDFSGARQAYQRLMSERAAQDTKVYTEIQPQLEAAVVEIERAAAGDKVLKLRGRVGGHSYWVHPLLRRSFSLGNIEGSLEVLSIRCTRRAVSFTSVTDENVWTIPASYGDCSVYLKGTPGATFDFYEHPVLAAEVVLPPADSSGAAGSTSPR